MADRLECPSPKSVRKRVAPQASCYSTQIALEGRQTPEGGDADAMQMRCRCAGLL
jgi:hypothetical protein